MRKIDNPNLIRGLLIMMVIIALLLNTVGVSSSSNSNSDDKTINTESPGRNNNTAEPAPAAGSRDAGSNGPFCDVVVEPNPIVFNSSDKTWINFTFEEYNGHNFTIKSNSFEFLTVKNECIRSAWSSLFLKLLVPAGANATWPYNYQVKPDLLLSLKQNGTYKFYLNASFIGIDDSNNEFEINKKVPVFLKLKVAVIVYKSIYQNLKTKLQRYYNDVNTKIKVEFIERNGTWTTPEGLRNYIKTLWMTYNISGVILVGYFPIPMWEIIHSQNNTEKCPIPIFYEDLDGSFMDTDSNSYYDRHYWGANDGPEIWVSFIMPPIRGQTIPSTHLDPCGTETGGGLTGYYYEDNSLTIYNGSRIDSVIDFDWEDESLFNNIYPDNFSVRWTGKLKVDKNETYSFYTEAKGGVRLWIDGVTVINRAFDFTDYMYQNYGSKYLTMGWYDIKVEYYENGKGPDEYGMLRLSWSSPTLKIKTIEKFLDKTHQYYTGKLGQPDESLLFMDYCYGMQCKMKKPIKIRLLDPLYTDNIVVGGCQNNTNASEYLELLKSGYELTSVWSHAGSTYHHIKPLDDPNAPTSAPYWKVRKRPAGLVTLIWGCHAGDIMSGGNFERALSNNLVANYAFNTGLGLAAVGCTRSYGTTFRETYFALQNQSYLGLGYFYFKDYSYNRSLLVQSYPNNAKDKWIDDEILMGDPFIAINHRPTDLELTMENDRKWINYRDVTLKLSCTNSKENSNEMSFRASDGTWTTWEPYSPTKSWQLSSGAGNKKIEFRMRNSFGYSFNNAYDIIGIDTEPPVIVSLVLNDGKEVIKNRTVKFELDVMDDLSGPHWVSFSHDGKFWSDCIDYSTIIYWNLTCESDMNTVYIKVQDGAGNQAQIVSKEIRLDTTKIITNAIINGRSGENEWYVSPVTVELDFELESPVFDRIVYRLNGGSWEEYSILIQLDNSGCYNVEYYGTDIYGFKESIRNCTVRVDLELPQELKVNINNGKSITNSTKIKLDISAYDALSGCWLMRFSEDSKNWGEWLNYSTFSEYTFSNNDLESTRFIYVQVQDFAGNIIKEPAMDDIYVDCVNPLIVHVTPVDGEKNVCVNTNITIEFSEDLKTELVNDKNIYLIDSERNFIHGTLEYRSDAFILVITPNSKLEHYTTYSLYIEPNLQDLAGNALGVKYIYNFTTVGLAPGYVQNLKAKLAEKEIYITWEPPLDFGSEPIQGFKIYKCINSGTLEFMHKQSVKELYYIDTRVEFNDTYSYTVSAYNLIGDGPRCETVSVYVPTKEPMIPDIIEYVEEKPGDEIFADDRNIIDPENEILDGSNEQRSKSDNNYSNLFSLVLGIIVAIIIVVITLFAFLLPKKKPIENTIVNDPVLYPEPTIFQTQQVEQPQQQQQCEHEHQQPLPPQQLQDQYEQSDQQEQERIDEAFNEYQEYRRARGL